MTQDWAQIWAFRNRSLFFSFFYLFSFFIFYFFNDEKKKIKTTINREKMQFKKPDKI